MSSTRFAVRRGGHLSDRPASDGHDGIDGAPDLLRAGEEPAQGRPTRRTDIIITEPDRRVFQRVDTGRWRRPRRVHVRKNSRRESICRSILRHSVGSAVMARPSNCGCARARA